MDPVVKTDFSRGFKLITFFVVEARLGYGLAGTVTRCLPAAKTASRVNRNSWLDPEYFRRALWALAENALKYNRPAGRVGVTVSRDSGGKGVITVADTGRGIAPADLPKIFDRFFRGDPARSQGQGFGLGLSLAKEIVAAHGGAIGVESRPEVGSVFTIALPAPASAGEED